MACNWPAPWAGNAVSIELRAYLSPPISLPRRATFGKHLVSIAYVSSYRMKIEIGRKRRIFEIKKPYTYRPPHISQRIPAQQAVFTVHSEPDKVL